MVSIPQAQFRVRIRFQFMLSLEAIASSRRAALARRTRKQQRLGGVRESGGEKPEVAFDLGGCPTTRRRHATAFSLAEREIKEGSTVVHPDGDKAVADSECGFVTMTLHYSVFNPQTLNFRALELVRICFRIQSRRSSVDNRMWR